MIIHNTTNIPSKLVAVIYEVVKPQGLTKDVTSITLRNKTEGKISGNWGKFYSGQNKITLCVPQIIDNHISHTPVGKFRRVLKGKGEWLATVIGHEAFHAWQYENERDSFHVSDYIEVCAERYEVTALRKWSDYLASLSAPQPLKLAATGS